MSWSRRSLYLRILCSQNRKNFLGTGSSDIGDGSLPSKLFRHVLLWLFVSILCVMLLHQTHIFGEATGNIWWGDWQYLVRRPAIFGAATGNIWYGDRQYLVRRLAIFGEATRNIWWGDWQCLVRRLAIFGEATLSICWGDWQYLLAIFGKATGS